MDPTTPEEVIYIHQSAQRTGFIAGVIVTIAAHYYWKRKREYLEYRRENIQRN